MKNLMYLTNEFVSKESFSRENLRWGFEKIYRVAFENFYGGGQKFLRLTFFSRYADCQLGGGEGGGGATWQGRAILAKLTNLKNYST